MKIFGTAIKLVLITGAGLLACSGGVGSGAGVGDGNNAGTGGSAASGGSSAGTGSGATGGLIIGTGGTGATAGTGTGGVGNCPFLEENADPKPPVIQLVEDTSGSMNDDAPGGMGTKWEVTRDALKVAIGQMPPTMALGMSFYPNTDDMSQECINNQIAAPIALLDDPHKAVITAALDAQAAQDGTPTFEAFNFGVTTLEGTTVPGNKFVVLITDGAPTYGENCSGDGQTPVDNDPLIARVAAVAATGIRTFVIGSPGSEPAREDLSRMAEAGGTAKAGCNHMNPNFCHFDMTTQADLGQALIDALNEITGSLGCAFTIPPAPPGQTLDLNKINVWYLPGGVEPGNLIPKEPGAIPTPCMANGWQFSADGRQVLLCGQTCETVKADPNGIIRIQFGCDTIVTGPQP